MRDREPFIHIGRSTYAISGFVSTLNARIIDFDRTRCEEILVEIYRAANTRW